MTDIKITTSSGQTVNTTDENITQTIEDLTKPVKKRMVAGSLDAPTLISFVERVETLTKDQKAIQADIKEVMSEAKSAGYDPKYIRRIVRARAKDPDQLEEEIELTRMYGNAVDMELV